MPVPVPSPGYGAVLGMGLVIIIVMVMCDLPHLSTGMPPQVVYGEKMRPESGMAYQGHVEALAPTVQRLAEMEHLAQTAFLQMGRHGSWMAEC